MLLPAGGQYHDGHRRVRPDLPGDLDPVAVRQAQVEEDDVGSVAARLLQAVAGRAGLSHPIALALQRRTEKPADRLFVLDHEHQGAMGGAREGGHVAASTASAGTWGCGRSIGSEKRNATPPGVLRSAQIRPPWALTMPSQMVRPSPMPPCVLSPCAAR